VRDRAAIGNEGHGWPNAAKPRDVRLLAICHDSEESLRLYIVRQRFALRGLVRDRGAPVRSGLPAGIYGAMDGGVKRHWDVLEAVPDGRAEGMGALG